MFCGNIQVWVSSLHMRWVYAWRVHRECVPKMGPNLTILVFKKETSLQRWYRSRVLTRWENKRQIIICKICSSSLLDTPCVLRSVCPRVAQAQVRLGSREGSGVKSRERGTQGSHHIPSHPLKCDPVRTPHTTMHFNNARTQRDVRWWEMLENKPLITTFFSASI